MSGGLLHDRSISPLAGARRGYQTNWGPCRLVVVCDSPRRSPVRYVSLARCRGQSHGEGLSAFVYGILGRCDGEGLVRIRICEVHSARGSCAQVYGGGGVRLSNGRGSSAT